MRSFWAIILLTFLSAFPLKAQSLIPANFQDFMVCTASHPDETPATLDQASCQPGTLENSRPFGRMLWLVTDIDVTADYLEQHQPLGFYFSGKASVAVYLNGQKLGQNGQPGLGPESEIPGLIDAVFNVPPSVIHPGRNTIHILMSGHHGFIPLAHPIHLVAMAPYASPSQHLMERYLPSLPPLGVLVIGLVYFSLLSFRHRENRSLVLPSLAALFASGQLLAEISRGITAYSYPFQDIRLILILGFAAASGICLLLHVINRFVPKRRLDVLLGGVGIMALAVHWSPSFDAKAIFAVLVPAAVCTLIAATAVYRRQPKAVHYTLALATTSLGIYLTTSDFLDIYYYYLVAGLLMFLFIQQLKQIAAEKKLRQQEQTRADRLQLALDEKEQQTSPSAISVKQAGALERISTKQIQYCQGARDYVELHLADGASKLHGGSLTELEGELPSTFLRVHRSYIVNTSYIDRLERENSGSGLLHLTTGAAVPVSRRIMPSVRKALA